ncbi:hypothetical protein CEXT_407301 [Caerostris extrusa]|uniref:Uncharacterized protein n=1 Tax=Caerostris extrusa TaxID=172846 RepID=A0AAV4T335_CAEEX|nr:hypothetical protein CEXT_407301 [Caerostris extrusa]
MGENRIITILKLSFLFRALLVVTVGHNTRDPPNRKVGGKFIAAVKMGLKDLFVLQREDEEIFFSFSVFSLFFLSKSCFFGVGDAAISIALLDFDFCLCDFTSSLTPPSTPLFIICTSVDCLELVGAFPNWILRLCKAEENSFTTQPFLYDNQIFLRLASSVFVHPLLQPPVCISVVNIGNHHKKLSPPGDVLCNTTFHPSRRQEKRKQSIKTKSSENEQFLATRLLSLIESVLATQLK